MLGVDASCSSLSALYRRSVLTDEWEVAQVLALTKEEAQDIQDSELRVKAMRKEIDERNFPQAYEYAITDNEREQIYKAEKLHVSK